MSEKSIAKLSPTSTVPKAAKRPFRPSSAELLRVPLAPAQTTTTLRINQEILQNVQRVRGDSIVCPLMAVREALHNAMAYGATRFHVMTATDEGLFWAIMCHNGMQFADEQAMRDFFLLSISLNGTGANGSGAKISALAQVRDVNDFKLRLLSRTSDKLYAFDAYEGRSANESILVDKLKPDFARRLAKTFPRIVGESNVVYAVAFDPARVGRGYDRRGFFSEDMMMSLKDITPEALENVQVNVYPTPILKLGVDVYGEHHQARVQYPVRKFNEWFGRSTYVLGAKNCQQKNNGNAITYDATVEITLFDGVHREGCQDLVRVNGEDAGTTDSYSKSTKLETSFILGHDNKERWVRCMKEPVFIGNTLNAASINLGVDLPRGDKSLDDFTGHEHLLKLAGRSRKGMLRRPFTKIKITITKIHTVNDRPYSKERDHATVCLVVGGVDNMFWHIESTALRRVFQNIYQTMVADPANAKTIEKLRKEAASMYPIQNDGLALLPPFKPESETRLKLVDPKTNAPIRDIHPGRTAFGKLVYSSDFSPVDKKVVFESCDYAPSTLKHHSGENWCLTPAPLQIRDKSGDMSLVSEGEWIGDVPGMRYPTKKMRFTHNKKSFVLEESIDLPSRPKKTSSPGGEPGDDRPTGGEPSEHDNRTGQMFRSLGTTPEYRVSYQGGHLILNRDNPEVRSIFRDAAHGKAIRERLWRQLSTYARQANEDVREAVSVVQSTSQLGAEIYKLWDGDVAEFMFNAMMRPIFMGEDATKLKNSNAGFVDDDSE